MKEAGGGSVKGVDSIVLIMVTPITKLLQMVYTALFTGKHVLLTVRLWWNYLIPLYAPESESGET